MSYLEEKEKFSAIETTSAKNVLQVVCIKKIINYPHV